MQLHTLKVENIIVEQSLLQELMNKNGFTCSGGWDYQRMTYDFKFELDNDIYYLRIPTFSIEGDIGSGNAKLKILTPYVGKHYYPHGLEYGEEEFPPIILGRCEKLLKRIEKSLDNLPNSLH